MAFKTTTELLDMDPTDGGGPFYIFSLRNTAPDFETMTNGGGPFYTPHSVSGGTPPVVYNATQFMIMF